MPTLSDGFKFFLMILGSLIFVSCGTIYTLYDHEDSEQLIFSGIRMDIDIIVDPPAYPVPIGPGWYVLCFLDTPFSLVADTIVFPYTLPSDLLFRTPQKPTDFDVPSNK